MQGPYFIVKSLSGRVSDYPEKLCAVIAVLSSMFTWCSKSALGQERMFAANGSSVLLSAPPQDGLGVVQWMFLNGTETHAILDYFSAKKDLSIKPRYSKRVVFFPSNGSLLLKDVRTADDGEYKVRVDLREETARSTVLKVFEPPSEPKISINSSLVGSPAEIVCHVPLSQVDSIAWKKNGAPLPLDRCYQIINSSVVYIRKVEKSDCAYFSCNVSNPLYWKELSYKVTFEGTSPAVKGALWLSVAALVNASVATVLLISLFLLPNKKWEMCCEIRSRCLEETRTPEEQKPCREQPEEQNQDRQKRNFKRSDSLLRQAAECSRCLFKMCLHMFVSTSSLLLLIASAIWMDQKGVSAAFVLLLMFLLIVMLFSLLITVLLAFCKAKIKLLKDRRVSRVMLNCVAPGGLTPIVLFSTYLIHDIHRLQDEGCSELPKRFALSFAMLLFPIIITFMLVLLCASISQWSNGRSQPQGEIEVVDSGAEVLEMHVPAGLVPACRDEEEEEESPEHLS